MKKRNLEQIILLLAFSISSIDLGDTGDLNMTF
jgi:hypothetical protein